MPNIFITIISALLATLVIESFIILPLFRSHCVNFSKLILNFILINAITNISLNTILIISRGRFDITLLGELFIPLIEAQLFKIAGVTRNRKSTIIICYFANFLSYVVGICISLLLIFYHPGSKPLEIIP